MKTCITCGFRTARWWFGGRVCYGCAGVRMTDARSLAADERSEE